jgi:Plasmid pRiA4b ORF-3-like protein
MDVDIYVLVANEWFEVSPIIRRRPLVSSDSTIADLHDTPQIAFGWSDDHPHRFLIHGKQYGSAGFLFVMAHVETDRSKITQPPVAPLLL